MINPISAHDQALAFIHQDSLFLKIDGALSFEIIAHEFEGYWRQQISEEIRAKLMPICICEKCGNQQEARYIEDAIRVAKGGSR